VMVVVEKANGCLLMMYVTFLANTTHAAQYKDRAVA